MTDPVICIQIEIKVPQKIANIGTSKVLFIFRFKITAVYSKCRQQVVVFISTSNAVVHIKMFIDENHLFKKATH